MIFNGGLITLPPVPLHLEDDVFKTPHQRSSSHHKARHRLGRKPQLLSLIVYLGGKQRSLTCPPKTKLYVQVSYLLSSFGAFRVI